MIEVQIIGTGSYVPKQIMTNEDLSNIVDTSDEWISSRTGIQQRRISINENTSALAIQAAQNALQNASISAEEIDLIIVATMSPDSFMPSTACIVQGALGAKNASAFDISAACTGFIYALNIGNQLIRAGQNKTVLVVGAEVLSKLLDWQDRNTCVLFGDGAGAVVLRASSEKGVLSCYTGADGQKAELLQCPAVQIQNPYQKTDSFVPSVMSMNGNEVFKFAGKIIVESIENVLKDTGYGVEDITCIIPHQANIRIIEYAAKKMNIEPERFYTNLDRYGNTSAASIPLALDEMVQQRKLQKGDKIIFIGFGSGLTWGAVLIQW